MKMSVKLAEYIQEVIDEGGQVLLFREGNDNYSICNITGDAFKQLQKILNNGGKI